MIGHAFPKHKLNDIPWAATPRLRFTQGKKTKLSQLKLSQLKVEKALDDKQWVDASDIAIIKSKSETI